MLKPANACCCPRAETGSATTIGITKIAVMANVPVFSCSQIIWYILSASQELLRIPEKLWIYLENRYFH